MRKILFLAAAAALVSVSAAKATEYEFNFSGAGYTASGEFAVVAGKTGSITTITGTSTLGSVKSSIASNGVSSSLSRYTWSNTFTITLAYNDSLVDAFIWTFPYPRFAPDPMERETGSLSVTLAGGAAGAAQQAYGTVDPVAAPLPAPGAGLLSFSFLAAAGLWPRIKAFASSARGGKRPRAARA